MAFYFNRIQAICLQINVPITWLVHMAFGDAQYGTGLAHQPGPHKKAKHKPFRLRPENTTRKMPVRGEDMYDICLVKTQAERVINIALL